jgi:hypothetical protein
VDTYGKDLTLNDDSSYASEVTQFDRNEAKNMTPIHWSAYGKKICFLRFLISFSKGCF